MATSAVPSVGWRKYTNELPVAKASAQRAVRVTDAQDHDPGDPPAGDHPAERSRRTTSRGPPAIAPQSPSTCSITRKSPTGIREPSITFGRAWRARVRTRGISKCVDIDWLSSARGRPPVEHLGRRSQGSRENRPMCTSGRPVRAVILDFFGTAGPRHRLGRPRRDRGPPRLHPPRAPPARCGGAATSTAHEHVEQSRSRDHYLAWQRERLLAMLARGRRPPRRARDASSTTSRRDGPSGCSRPTTRCPACSTTLRERGPPASSICSNWDWDLEPAIAEVGLAGPLRHRGVVGVGGRPQAAPADLPLPDRAGRSRPRSAATCCSWATPGAPTSRARSRRACGRPTSSATGTGPTRRPPTRRTRPRRPVARIRDLTGIVPSSVGTDRLEVAVRVRRRGRSAPLHPCGRGRRRTRRAGPLPGCGSRCPGWPRSARTRRARPHGR